MYLPNSSRSSIYSWRMPLCSSELKSSPQTYILLLSPQQLEYIYWFHPYFCTDVLQKQEKLAVVVLRVAVSRLLLAPGLAQKSCKFSIYLNPFLYDLIKHLWPKCPQQELLMLFKNSELLPFKYLENEIF